MNIDIVKLVQDNAKFVAEAVYLIEFEGKSYTAKDPAKLVKKIEKVIERKNQAEAMKLEDFIRANFSYNSDFKFDLFDIVCKKCGSSHVEFNGKTDTEYGYYGAIDFTNLLIVKCHDCGNAFGMTFKDSGSSNYCPTCDY
jgi:rubrerythrin